MRITLSKTHQHVSRTAVLPLPQLQSEKLLNRPAAGSDSTRTSVLFLKPKTNSTVSKSPISQSVSESCSGSATLVDVNTDLNADWPTPTLCQSSCCVNSLKSGDFGPSITPDSLESNKSFSVVLYLVGPVWPSRSKTRQVWNLTAILSTVKASSTQQGNKMRRARGEKLFSARLTHKYNLHHQIWGLHLI